MKIEILYILDCPWCVKTKNIIRQVINELNVKATVKEILIDSPEKAKKYNFQGSPTVRINDKDIQEEISKGKCKSCEDIAKNSKTTGFVKQECSCGCRIYLHKNKVYPYPPKSMIKEVIKGYF